MTVRICERCQKPLPDGEQVCPECGFAQEQGGIVLTRIPTTIEELREFCEEQGMPLEKMRFFIGEDYQEPKAFGIFRDESGDFVVYKNKADGSRAVRYHGPDEAYAVRELYEKLKSEVELRNGGGVSGSRGMNQSSKRFVKAVLAFIIVVWLIVGTSLFFAFRNTPRRGYYRYHDTEYYYLDNWYYYDTNYDNWYEVDDVPEAFEESYRDYYDGESHKDSYDSWDFSETDYYDDYDWSSSSSSYDSWDSGGTDWSSDW